MTARATFGTKIGIIAATTGSAVGLGNIWRFPSETASGGGAIFVFVYVACVLFFGIPILLAEFIVGRAGKANPSGAYRNLAPKTPFRYFGAASVLVAFLIMGFYMVVSGWVLEYFWLAVSGGLSNTSDFGGVFKSLADNSIRQCVLMVLFVVSSAVVVGFGIKKGIELASKIMMPALLVILIGMCACSVTMPGAGAGLSYLFSPNFSDVTPKIFFSALGQCFFSLSLCGGALMTYASYFGRDVNLGRTAFYTATIDIVVAVLAGVTIFSTAFAAAGTAGIDTMTISETLRNGGPGLVFITLPQLFAALPLGQLWSVLFFLLLLLATLTSAISLFEVPTSFMQEEFKLSRTTSVMIIAVGVIVFGALSAISLGSNSPLVFFGRSFFEWLDYSTAKVMMPIGGIFVSWFIGWYIDKKIVVAQLTNSGTLPLRFLKAYIFILRYVAPIGIISIFISSFS